MGFILLRNPISRSKIKDSAANTQSKRLSKQIQWSISHLPRLKLMST